MPQKVALRGLQKGRAVTLDVRAGLAFPLLTGAHTRSLLLPSCDRIKTDAASVYLRE